MRREHPWKKRKGVGAREEKMENADEDSRFGLILSNGLNTDCALFGIEVCS
jgi:hypothetical protein